LQDGEGAQKIKAEDEDGDGDGEKFDGQEGQKYCQNLPLYLVVVNSHK